MLLLHVKLLGRAHDESVNYFVKQVKLRQRKEAKVPPFTVPRILKGSAASLPWSDGPLLFMPNRTRSTFSEIQMHFIQYILP